MVLLGLALLAWFNRFTQDDAFISYRYADHLIRGYGLVWNIGEPIEGYTNFLWVLIIAAGMYMGWEPILFSYLVGISLFVLTLIFTYLLAKKIFTSRIAGLFTILLLGTNYTFNAYATGGLETQLQVCLLVISTYLLYRIIFSNEWKIWYILIISVLLSLAALTRLDSLLLNGMMFLLFAYFLVKSQQSIYRKLALLLTAVLPFVLIVGTWFKWKLDFYGSLLPNTFYAKVSEYNSMLAGVDYLYTFFNSYSLIPFVFLTLLFMYRSIRDKKNLPIFLFLFYLIPWFAYIVKVGGDFMEFRFMVPVLPYLFIIVTWCILKFFERTDLKVLLTTLVLFGSISHAYAFDGNEMIESKTTLYGHVIQNDFEDWNQIGKVLGKAFQYNPRVKIAITPAGGIAFYSRLTTIDMLGLNDKWIAKHGQPFIPKNGHQKISSLSYLKNQKVNLLIGHPQMVPKWDNRDLYFTIQLNPLIWMNTFDRNLLPKEAKVIEIPINRDFKLITIYLTPDPYIDEVIRKHNWKVVPII